MSPRARVTATEWARIAGWALRVSVRTSAGPSLMMVAQVAAHHVVDRGEERGGRAAGGAQVGGHADGLGALAGEQHGNLGMTASATRIDQAWAAATLAGRSARICCQATFTALVMASSLLRPWAMMLTPSTPSSMAPPATS